MDVTPPIILQCPTSFVVTAPFNAGTDFVVTWTEPFAIDNAGNPTLILRSNQPGDSFTVGQTTTVVYAYADNAALTSTCQFNVTVIRMGK